MKSDPKVILGIDPGTVLMGYGIIRITGNQPVLVDMGVLKPGRIEEPYKKLQLIYETVSGLILKYHPGSFAIEAPFFGKNVQSMLKLGRAQGVAIAAAMQHGLTVTEYSPKKVKQAVTGNGNAAKEQVLTMMQHLLKFKETPASLDASDALAVAVCHYLQQSAPVPVQPVSKKKSNTKSNSWDQFIRQNPSRISNR